MFQNDCSEVNLLYSEGAINLNWTNLLAEIRENPEEFVKEKGWGFLQQDSESEEGEEEPAESDSNFEPEEVASASDYSDEDEDESEDYTDEESEKGESITHIHIEVGESLDEEGKSWDELEKEAAKSNVSHKCLR